MITEVKNFLGRESKISILKFFSITSILFSIFNLVFSARINIKNKLSRIQTMNNDIHNLINYLQKSIKYNKYLTLYFLGVVVFAFYRYQKKGLTKKVVLLLISSILGLFIKISVIFIEIACINELNTFKDFINGNIKDIDNNPNIIDKLKMYNFNYNENYFNIFKDKILKENFESLKDNEDNYDRVQLFLDNSLILKYQNYLILIYTFQIFINLILVYLPMFI